MKNTIQVQWLQVSLASRKEWDYISLTDIARYKSPETDQVISNWMRNRNTVEFLWVWETLNNPDFKPLEFEGFKKEAWLNAFLLSPKKWIDSTDAIGIISRSGRYGGTYAHRDIAFEFASWISVEFKLYLITEFQRLKEIEQEKQSLGWDVKRELAKVNYRIHTDAIKDYLLPTLTEVKKRYIYADEADFLNVLVFWETAKMWQDENPELPGNMRDHADALDLVILSNIENHNAQYISEWLTQEDRYLKLRDIIMRQRKSLGDAQALIWLDSAT